MEAEEEAWREEVRRVLVMGGTGRLGAWVVLGLLREGFRMWVMRRRREQAGGMFGPGGSNVEVVEGELWGVAGVEAGALEGYWELVMCVGMSALEGLLGGIDAVEGRGVAHSLAAATRAGLHRLVLVSARRGPGAAAAAAAPLEMG